MKPLRAFEWTGESGRGFVLVGVVVMVLALTILGLSLFSLSSYEAQFMHRALDDEQALHFAMGGLDRARFALSASPQMLSNVKLNLPRDNVVYARASQPKGGPSPDTTGEVLWDGDSITVRVMAAYRNIVRTVEATYRPMPTANYYRRPMTVAHPTLPITVNAVDLLGRSRSGTILLPDSVWQQGGSTSWRNILRSPYPPVMTGGGIPVPDAANFINSHASSFAPAISGQEYRLEADANGDLKFFYSGATTTNFTLWDQTSMSPVIWVRGRAVWCVKKGVRFENLVQIRRAAGDPDACLVIVAHNGFDPTGDPGAVWFFGGLTSEIPVILVSDGWVKLEHFNAPDKSTSLPALSVFANQVLLMGPLTSSTGLMTIGHPPAVMDPQLEFLMSQGALPNSAVYGGSALRLSAGTWRVVQ